MCILYYYIISSIDRQTMKNIVDQRTSKCKRWWFPALVFRGTSSVRYLREVQDLSSGASCWGWSSLQKGREHTSLFSTFVYINVYICHVHSFLFISIHFYPFLIFNKPGRNCNLNIDLNFKTNWVVVSIPAHHLLVGIFIPKVSWTIGLHSAIRRLPRLFAPCWPVPAAGKRWS